MPKREKAFSELSKEEKLKRVRRARRKARAVQVGPTRSNVQSETAAAWRAEKAANRVETRLTGKAPSRLDATQPGKRAGALGELIRAAKKAASLPGKLKSGLEQVKEASKK